MLSIGDFARHGRVSVRMLRHYDGIGLLRPVHVDPVTGYRSYDAGQLADLNQVIALKDLGFSLGQVATLIADGITSTQLRAMLTLRRAELEQALAEGAARLTQIEARLRGIDAVDPAPAVVLKDLPATRFVGLSGTAASFTPDDIAPVIRPLCGELGDRLAGTEGIRPAGRLTCLYERAGATAGDTADEDQVRLRAAVPAAVDSDANSNGLELYTLPATQAATLVYRGPIDQVLPAWQALARWIDENGYRSAEPARELYLDCPDDPKLWVTELQEALVARGR